MLSSFAKNAKLGLTITCACMLNKASMYECPWLTISEDHTFTHFNNVVPCTTYTDPFLGAILELLKPFGG